MATSNYIRRMRRLEAMEQAKKDHSKTSYEKMDFSTKSKEAWKIYNSGEVKTMKEAWKVLKARG